MTSATIVVGLQWGDEGKGKAIDLLARPGALVVRFQGGDNAGHTVVIGDEVFKLHLVPSGVLHEHITPVIVDGSHRGGRSPRESKGPRRMRRGPG